MSVLQDPAAPYNAKVEAFEGIFNGYYRTMVRYASSILGPDAGEDVANEAFLRVWRSPDTYESQEGKTFFSWLSSITKNVALDEIRKRKSKGAIPVAEIFDSAAPRGLTPLAQVIARETLNQVRDIKFSDADGRAVLPFTDGELAIRYEMGVKLVEEAKNTGVSTSVISRRIERARVAACAINHSI
jgi:RNA polymerase sigma factor (sigma-70 family)